MVRARRRARQCRGPGRTGVVVAGAGRGAGVSRRGCWRRTWPPAPQATARAEGHPSRHVARGGEHRSRAPTRRIPGGRVKRWPNSAARRKRAGRSPSTGSPASARPVTAWRRTCRRREPGAAKRPNTGSPKRSTAWGCATRRGWERPATRPRPRRGSGGRPSGVTQRRCSTWGCATRPETGCLATTAKRRTGIAERPSAVIRRPSSTLACATFRGAASRRTTALAAWWYRRSADQGHASAQFNLGVRCAHGDGVPKDLVEAYWWVHLAAVRSSGARQGGTPRRWKTSRRR